MDSNKRSRKWCGTLNNYSEQERLLLLETDCDYAIIGKEVGLLGTPHLQMFFYFKTMKSFSQMKALHRGVHWDIARGTSEENSIYCSKEGDFEIIGEPPMTKEEQGRLGAQAYSDAWTFAKAGEIESIEASIRLKCYHTLRTIEKDYQPRIQGNDFTCGYWYFGPSGCGKSKAAYTEFPEAYRKSCNKWWDNYLGEKIVIMDDVDKGHAVLGHHLKLWADHYPFHAESKGSSRMIRPEKFIVTSQYRIEEIWPDVETQDALNRRFTIKEFSY